MFYIIIYTIYSIYTLLQLHKNIILFKSMLKCEYNLLYRAGYERLFAHPRGFGRTFVRCGVTPPHSQNAKKHFSKVKCKRGDRGMEQNSPKVLFHQKALWHKGLGELWNSWNSFFLLFSLEFL